MYLPVCTTTHKRGHVVVFTHMKNGKELLTLRV